MTRYSIVLAICLIAAGCGTPRQLLTTYRFIPPKDSCLIVDQGFWYADPDQHSAKGNTGIFLWDCEAQ